MQIVLIGAGGQLGTALTARLGGKVIPLGSSAIDIADAEQVRRVLPELCPDLVINAAAYNFVDRAEDEFERAYAVNATGPQAVAQVCAALDIPFVHVSTDYVYGGVRDRNVPYVETDPPCPTSQYARSKLAGEDLVQAACPKYFVVRTCGLYGRAVSPGKGNFVETMLRLGRERGAVSVVGDQCCTPTSAADLAGAIAELITTQSFGLYHAANEGNTTWHGFASEIFRLAGLDVAVTPITTAQFNAKATRPSYSVLDCSKLGAAIGRPMRPWQEALAEYLISR
ncbi:MAG TPA: dTDP-4-dehydrorhamnose reductase [Planctomycetaceae bacterium]|jgi:dTDP-4-dehydrorhamnose reductase